MAISTKSELKAKALSYLARSGLSTHMDDFVKFAESRLNRDLPLTAFEIDTALTGTIGSRELALPDDFVEPISLDLTTWGFDRLIPRTAGVMQYLSTNGTPSEWIINGSNIDLDCPCNQAHTFSFRYRQSFALEEDDDTNWLLTHHPDVYLAAVLAEAFGFARNFDAASAWGSRTVEAIDAIHWKDARSKSIGQLSVDAGLQTPALFNIQRG
jgi:hypothetical protein